VGQRSMCTHTHRHSSRHSRQSSSSSSSRHSSRHSSSCSSCSSGSQIFLLQEEEAAEEEMGTRQAEGAQLHAEGVEREAEGVELHAHLSAKREGCVQSAAALSGLTSRV
jgi:hypothetical protein